MRRALFVNHRGQRCGVFQFGHRLAAALRNADLLAWTDVECADGAEFTASLREATPDLVLFNHHPSTMPWADAALLESVRIPKFAVLHECDQQGVDALAETPFDFLLCPDPTLAARNPRALPVPRLITQAMQDPGPPPEVFTVGSFGFATPGKGFEQLCALVNDQFETARIRLNLPLHDTEAIVPPEMLQHAMDACRAAVTKPGIALEITHDFLDDAALLRFLAGNTINVFAYHDMPARGIASAVDQALASGRPFAVTRTSMFRHLRDINPSILVEERSLAAIAADGIAPVAHLRHQYRGEVAAAGWNAAILDGLQRIEVRRSVPDGRGFNKILDDRSRDGYAPVIARMVQHAPDMMSRKYPRANVQQAFGLDTAERLLRGIAEPRILAAGSFEDTSVAVLRAQGYRVDEVDPNVNGMDLESFYRLPEARLGSYDMVLSISVLEHVAQDAMFVRMIADLLKPGGVAVLTLDFSEAYAQTGTCPEEDHRLYTQHDLGRRLMDVLPDCALLDPPAWHDGTDEFEYRGHHYSFASFVFRRLPPHEAGRATELLAAGGGPAWSRLLARSVDISSRLQEHNRMVEEVIGRSVLSAGEAMLHYASVEAELMAALQAARTERDAIIQSTSWKLTRPLRAAMRLLRR